MQKYNPGYPLKIIAGLVLLLTFMSCTQKAEGQGNPVTVAENSDNASSGQAGNTTATLCDETISKAFPELESSSSLDINRIRKKTDQYFLEKKYGEISTFCQCLLEKGIDFPEVHLILAESLSMIFGQTKSMDFNVFFRHLQTALKGRKSLVSEIKTNPHFDAAKDSGYYLFFSDLYNEFSPVKSDAYRENRRIIPEKREPAYFILNMDEYRKLDDKRKAVTGEWMSSGGEQFQINEDGSGLYFNIFEMEGSFEEIEWTYDAGDDSFFIPYIGMKVTSLRYNSMTFDDAFSFARLTTPFHEAVKHGDIRKTAMLVRQLDTPFYTDSTGIYTVFDYAMRGRNPAIIGLLLEMDFDLNDFHILSEAIDTDEMEIINMFIKKGFNPFILDEQTGNSLLHIIANNKNPDVTEAVRYLLDQGLSPELENKKGETPYDRGLKYGGNPEILDIIKPENTSGN